ncbi:F-box/LRR-repeat protein 2 isoform X1 [Procambarus clarkii]|uniref:F-box/LRR-repeat protein 2 isoform X1 n=1 Tax=Procambarus clarkii TaxID=6728 RepID=UPI001E678A8D|nr:F-box/LRR-repeat protein 2-like isoform X1 [Procambarus clarkii]XP_045597444.1 F-box/LRR-repeat protein 2-like isoform X1 [Procambarus clarkii]XP_045597450.1 F-box/LRR-repeat protein 2-like isoform X1 [Procambarus clarkii]XP_045597457.1 F-box/LRR-repeat protein 2-like isoform X1 [Procambarus clarkii]
MAAALNSDSDVDDDDSQLSDSLCLQQVLETDSLEVQKPQLSNLIIEDLETLSSSYESQSTEQSCLSVFRGKWGGSHLQSCETSISAHDDSAGYQECSRAPHVTANSARGHCYISCLPNEVLLYIFSFLSVRELCVSVAPVCTSWRALARDPTLWTHLVFTSKHRLEKEQMVRLLRASPLLRSLELERSEDDGDLLLQAAALCTKLRRIIVKFGDGLTETVFKALTEKCPNVRYLNVEGSEICSAECYNQIACFRQLQYLNLSHCKFLENSGLITIARQCNQLEYLDIDGITGITDSSVLVLTTRLSHSLKSLLLDGEHLTDASYRSLGECMQLHKLGVSFCDNMTDVGLTGIYGLKQLTWLKLRKGTQLTPSGLRALFQSEGLRQLTYVNLGECCHMDDSVLSALASSSPNLQHLVLHWCWDVTDTGITALVTGCPRLRVLDLVGVVQLVGTAFINITTILPDLLILDLEQCNNIDDTILHCIAAEKPSLKLFDYWGDLVVFSDSDQITSCDQDNKWFDV